ncbi:microviridin/marinostatin family tricyclic proteinase inhibitor [Chryseobacterium sp. SSA4.19]|uniref:microviridin/marinostatin family tricyclic proteinase inhibitor n=1 Tax=Chryseobacterium sp. SSA4.19 TaxID=2919915 RepID=UPI001F4E01B7|nr:microviridin/marinostatin family tricyclic proteinase inhibitor [Chryseobacterium sp. SSA4.19]MCJ8153161.1 microviridin/marinostatin family tricyclic proteinase inhibitor [Chryseobacterium sp. SSA4.19]
MENKKSKKPFFASFLEKQIQDPEKVKGGATSPLLDNSTRPGGDHVTLKYPSDNDESGNAL